LFPGSPQILVAYCTKKLGRSLGTRLCHDII